MFSPSLLVLLLFGVSKSLQPSALAMITLNNRFIPVPSYCRLQAFSTDNHREDIQFSEEDVISAHFIPETENDEEAAIHQLFLQQIADAANDSKGRDAKTSNPSIRARNTVLSSSKNPVVRSRMVVETPATLVSGCPLELIHKQKLMFGNLVSVQGESGKRQSMIVRLQSEEEVVVDMGQIISVWDVLSDESAPQDREDWADVTAEALELLGKLSPRKSDLAEFWSAVTRRRTGLAVDSLDLGVYIYQEHFFRRWLQPHERDRGDCVVHALSAAQRYAAALLLFFDDLHFKRRPSTPFVETQYQYDDDSNYGSVRMVEGGYRALEDSVVLFKQGEAFLEVVKSRSQPKPQDHSSQIVSTNKSRDQSEAEMSPHRRSAVLRLLRALEGYAVAPTRVAAAPAVKHVLKRSGLPATPAGAQALLMKMGTVTRTVPGMTQTQGPSSTEQLVSTSSVGSSASSLINRLSRNRAQHPPQSLQTSGLAVWGPGVHDSAVRLAAEVATRREQLTTRGRKSGDTSEGVSKAYAPGKVGRRGPDGRVDLRDGRPVVCIDAARAVFFDDAFSLSPQTGELLVHVVDVCSYLGLGQPWGDKYGPLAAAARERVQAAYSPQGPLHMLPPQALESLCLSTTEPNEVITAALSVDFETGQVLGMRMFPSVIGPVTALGADRASDCLGAWDAGVSVPPLPGASQTVMEDLRLAHTLVQRIIQAQPWVDKQYSKAMGGGGRETRLDRRTGVYTYGSAARTPANRLVNTLLALYSNSSVTQCTAQGVPVPVAWENRDRTDTSRVQRFATQPLRSWLSQQQQMQVRAALGLGRALTKSECAIAVSHVNNYRQEQAPLKLLSRRQSDLEAFATHIEAVRLSGLSGASGGSDNGNSNPVLMGEVMGQGAVVRLAEFHVQGIVAGGLPANLERGQQVRVRVRSVALDSGNVILELV